MAAKEGAMKQYVPSGLAVHVVFAAAPEPERAPDAGPAAD